MGSELSPNYAKISGEIGDNLRMGWTFFGHWRSRGKSPLKKSPYFIKHDSGGEATFKAQTDCQPTLLSITAIFPYFKLWNAFHKKKNWLFIGHPDAGQRSAIIYSIVVSCQRHGIDPLVYLKDVLTRLPAMTNQDDIAALTPAKWKPVAQVS